MGRCGVGRFVLLAVLMALALVPPAASQTPAASAAGPRMSDGRPDLTGMWNGAARAPARMDTEEDGILTRLAPSRRCAPNQRGCRDNTNQSNDGEFTGRTNTNRPVYKPEYWDRVQFLDYDTNFSDPSFRCLPAGLPRKGAPTKIVQLPREVILFYSTPIETSNQQHYRIIPIDGRTHDANAFPSFYGDSIGHWDGDTLVVEAVGFNDQTWLSSGGYFHSFDLRVTERFRREGDVLHYDVTVEDPTVLMQPWVWAARQLRLNPDPQATIPEGLPCREYDSEITVSRIRH